MDYFYLMEEELPFRIQNKKPKTSFGAFLAHPSVIPFTNPSFRIYEYDAHGILDYHQFTSNLETSNELGELLFQEKYSFRSAYGVERIDINSLIWLRDTFKANNELWKEYLERAAAYRLDIVNEEAIKKKVCEIWQCPR